MQRRLVRSILFLGLLVAAGGGQCGAAQELVILGHGTVTLKNAAGDLMGPAKTCAEARCTVSFASTTMSVEVEAKAADHWSLQGLEGPDGAVLGGITRVSVDPNAGWKITVTFVELHLPDCTPTASPGGVPTLEAVAAKWCVGKYGSAEGTRLGSAGNCAAIGETLVTEKFGTDTSISVTVPANAPLGAQAFTVWTLDGTASTNVTVSNAPAPSIPSPPASVAIGTAVTLTGTGLSGTTSVKWELLSGAGGSGDATFTIVSDTELTVTIPAGTPAGSGLLRVVGDCGRAEPMVQFTTPG